MWLGNAIQQTAVQDEMTYPAAQPRYPVSECVRTRVPASCSVMRVERSASRRVASSIIFVAPHGLLSADSCVTMPPDDLWFYIRRYRHDTLTTADDRGHA